MRAAQNQVSPAADTVTELPPTLPTRALDLFTALPAWLQASVVLVLVVTFCLPRLLRALDDHLFNRTARRNITGSEDWVEVVRIRNEPRRLWGRRPAAEPTGDKGGEPSNPTTAETGTGLERGQEQAEPP